MVVDSFAGPWNESDGQGATTTGDAAHAVRRVRGFSIFDLDRTLTRRGTYSPFLLHCAWRAAPWRLLLVPAVLAAMIAYKLKLIDRAALKDAMQRLMLGRTVARATVERLVTGFADACAARGCYREATALIARERAEGREVVLATAAHRFYAAAIAERLGIAQVIATESHWDGDRLHARIVGANCYGAAKRDAMAAMLAARGLARGEAHVRFYSDDASDLPAFDWADQPFAVNPSAKLARIAAARGWPLWRWDCRAAQAEADTQGQLAAA